MEEKRAHRISSLPPVMVLKESGSTRMVFVFRSLLWGILTAFAAILLNWLAIGSFFHSDEVNIFLRIFFILLALAFSYSAVRSLTMRRLLEINFVKKTVHLSERSLFGNHFRTEPFDRFKQIIICKAMPQDTNYGMYLESKGGWIEYLGWNEFGAFSLASAMDLANQIAPKMGIEINAPTYFEEKSLTPKNR